MFVAISLITGFREQRSGREVAAFATPTVVHFAVVLVISAVLSAPWHVPTYAAVLLGLAGVGGVFYAARVIRHQRLQTGYTPDLEDRIWYAALPIVAYVALVVAAILLPSSPELALFGIGAITLLLLCVGIHNAWDSVTYIAIQRLQHPPAS